MVWGSLNQLLAGSKALASDWGFTYGYSIWMGIQFGREICGYLQTAESRERLITTRIGGYASGAVAGSLTRRYHRLLLAALKPPLGRTLVLYLRNYY